MKIIIRDGENIVEYVGADGVPHRVEFSTRADAVEAAEAIAAAVGGITSDGQD